MNYMTFTRESFSTSAEWELLCQVCHIENDENIYSITIYFENSQVEINEYL